MEMKEEVGSGEGWEESWMDAEHVYTRLGKFAGANRAETRNSRIRLPTPKYRTCRQILIQIE